MRNGASDRATGAKIATENRNAVPLPPQTPTPKPPHGPPAMSWIRVVGLFRPEVKVEVEAIAAVD